MIPQKKASEVIKLINSFNDAEPNEFQLASIRSEINKIEKAGHYSDAHQLYGMLAAFLGDIDSTKKHYEMAVKSSGAEPTALYNYAMAMHNLYQFKDAIEISNKYVSMYPDNISQLKELMSSHLTVCDINGAENIINKLIKIGVPENDTSIQEANVQLLTKKSILANNPEVDWKAICDRIQLVVEVFKKNKLLVYGVYELVTDEYITYEFLLKTSQDKLIEVDNHISEAISELPFSPIDECVVCSCASYDDYPKHLQLA